MQLNASKINVGPIVNRSELKCNLRITNYIRTRLVNKCMPMHLNANANISLDSNANAIFQERIQMQMIWGRMQMFWLHICKCI